MPSVVEGKYSSAFSRYSLAYEPPGMKDVQSESCSRLIVPYIPKAKSPAVSSPTMTCRPMEVVYRHVSYVTRCQNEAEQCTTRYEQMNYLHPSHGPTYLKYPK